MQTITRSPREITLADMEALLRQDWPADAVPCPTCDGSGEAVLGFRDCMPIQERCDRCRGFGYLRAGSVQRPAVSPDVLGDALVDGSDEQGL